MKKLLTIVTLFMFSMMVMAGDGIILKQIKQLTYEKDFCNGSSRHDGYTEC